MKLFSGPPSLVFNLSLRLSHSRHLSFAAVHQVHVGNISQEMTQELSLKIANSLLPDSCHLCVSALNRVTLLPYLIAQWDCWVFFCPKKVIHVRISLCNSSDNTEHISLLSVCGSSIICVNWGLPII